MNEYDIGYGNGGSLWDGIVNAATAAAGVVGAVKGTNAATPPASTKPVPPAGNTLGGVSVLVWIGGGLLLLVGLVLALRGK